MPNTWKNQDNIDLFYNQVDISTLRNYISQGGLSGCCDLDLIYHDVGPSKNLLEIGAGYGRVLNGLLARHFAGKITAIEPSKKFFKETQGLAKQCKLLNTSLQELIPVKKFDCVLWLWCGISDFTFSEQLNALKCIRKLMLKDGVLFIDTFPATQQPNNASSSSGQEYIVKSKNHTLRGYIPRAVEIAENAQQAHFELTQSYTYKTDTNRERWMYKLTAK